MWWTTLQLGVRNLMLHKLRSLLTMLGTILGVGSVIAMLAIGEGSKRRAVEQIRSLGAANVIIRSVKPGLEDEQRNNNATANGQPVSRVLEYGLKYDDFDRLLAAIPPIKQAVPIALVRKNVQFGRHRIPNGRILGTTPNYLSVKNLSLHRGRFLTDADLRRPPTWPCWVPAPHGSCSVTKTPWGNRCRSANVPFASSVCCRSRTPAVRRPLPSG